MYRYILRSVTTSGISKAAVFQGLGLQATSVLGGDLDATRCWCQKPWLPLLHVLQLIRAEGSGGSALPANEKKTSCFAPELCGKHSRLVQNWCLRYSFPPMLAPVVPRLFYTPELDFLRWINFRAFSFSWSDCVLQIVLGNLEKSQQSRGEQRAEQHLSFSLQRGLERFNEVQGGFYKVWRGSTRFNKDWASTSDLRLSTFSRRSSAFGLGLWPSMKGFGGKDWVPEGTEYKLQSGGPDCETYLCPLWPYY